MEGFAKYVTGNFLVWEESIGREEEQWVGMSVGDFKDMFGAERMRIVSVDYYGGVELFGLGDGFFFVFFFGGKLPPKYILPICSGRLN